MLGGIPVGVITAVIGAPFFLLLLRRARDGVRAVSGPVARAPTGSRSRPGRARSCATSRSSSARASGSRSWARTARASRRCCASSRARCDPTAGRVELGGTPIGELERPQIARRLAVVPQQVALPFAMRVEEVVALGRLPHEAPLRGARPSDRAAVAAAIERVGLGHLHGPGRPRAVAGGAPARAAGPRGGAGRAGDAARRAHRAPRPPPPGRGDGAAARPQRARRHGDGRRPARPRPRRALLPAPRRHRPRPARRRRAAIGGPHGRPDPRRVRRRAGAGPARGVPWLGSSRWPVPCGPCVDVPVRARSSPWLALARRCAARACGEFERRRLRRRRCPTRRPPPRRRRAPASAGPGERTPTTAETPTEAPPSDATPSGEASAAPSGSPDAGAAAACTGTRRERAFFADAAAAVDWTVVCAVLPNGLVRRPKGVYRGQRAARS